MFLWATKTHQLLTCSSVKFVWVAICFFSSSVGYGCYRRERERNASACLRTEVLQRQRLNAHRLTPMCWKSHDRMTLVACLGKTPRLFLVELSSWLKRFRSWWNCSWSWVNRHLFSHLSMRFSLTTHVHSPTLSIQCESKLKILTLNKLQTMVGFGVSAYPSNFLWFSNHSELHITVHMITARTSCHVLPFLYFKLLWGSMVFHKNNYVC